jgi:hypothetical protein
MIIEDIDNSFRIILRQIGPIILLIILLCFVTLPLIWFSYLPLTDYPNHLARLQIHKTLGTNGDLARFYEFHWRLTPNLGLDLLAQPLSLFLPIERVGKTVVIFCFVMIYLGTIVLNRELTHQNWGPSIFAGILLYNGAFYWGFINYMIGLGFAVWAFWAWVRYRGMNIVISIVLFTVLGGLVCLMHLYAFVIYGVCVAGYECSMFWEKIRIERQIRMPLFRIPFAAAVSLIMPLLALLRPVAGNRGRIVWGQSWGPQTFWDSVIKWKAQALASPIYSHHFLEKPLLLAVVVVLLWAVVTRTLVVSTRMLIPLAAFGVIFIAMPSEIWGGQASFADYRLPSGVAFIALASLGWGETSQLRIEVVRVLLLLCLIARIGSVILAWRPAQPIIAEYDAALQLVPPGARLFCAMDDSAWNFPPLVHVPVLAAAKRGVFEPGTFSDNGKGLQLLKKRDPEPESIRDSDYLLEIGNPQVEMPSGTSLIQVEHGKTFILYRINHGTL